MERWVCKECNKKWIFPVKKCVYCKGEISIERGTKFKVVGITKVNVPSPLHPIIPYNILIIEDEFGNKTPKKTMKDYKMGDEYLLEPAKSENSLSIVKILVARLTIIGLGISGKISFLDFIQCALLLNTKIFRVITQ